MKDDWMDVLGFEGVYEVSYDGEVRSVDRMVKDPMTGSTKFRKGRTLKQSRNTKGSPQVVLVKPDGKRKTVRVFLLMMEAFKDLDAASKFITDEDEPGRGKVYEFVNPEGDYVRVKNLSSFCKSRGLHVSNMCQVHAGNLNSCKGWKKFVNG